MPEKQQTNKGRPVEHLRKYGFQPGQSGNPAGRPKLGLTITDALREKFKDEKVRSEFVERMIELAKQGNTTAITQILGRLEGAVPNQLEVTQKGSQAITLDFSNVTDDVLKEAVRNMGKDGKK